MPELLEELPREAHIERLTMLRDSLLRDAPKEQRLANLEAISDFSKYLMATYPNFNQYETWHVIGASTTDFTPEHFDFPGDDSIEQFLDKLATKKYTPSNN